MKKIPAFIFLLLFTFTFSNQQTLAANPNLIANPGLENTTADSPNQWSQVSWGNVTPAFIYPVAGHTGNTAQVTLPSNSSGDARWSHASVAVEAGVVYEFSGWYKSTVASELNTMFTSSNNNVSWGWVASLPSSGNVWKQIVADVTIPADVTKVTVFNLINKQGSLAIDDYSLVKKDGITPPPPVDGFAEGMITFSFDDAWTSQYTNALTILQNNGIKGTYFITTDPVNNNWPEYMNSTQVKDIATKGHEIGGHTLTHADLTTLTTANIDKEIKNSKSYLQNLTGKTVTSLAYPYGSFNTVVKNRTKKAGYSNGRSASTAIAEGFNSATQNKFEINSFSPTNQTTVEEMKNAIDRAKSNKEWLVFSFHRIENSPGEYFTPIYDFRTVVNYAKTSGIKTVTMEEGTALLK